MESTFALLSHSSVSPFLLVRGPQFPPRLLSAPHSQWVSGVGHGWLKPISSAQLPGYGDCNKFYHIRCKEMFAWDLCGRSSITGVEGTCKAGSCCSHFVTIKEFRGLHQTAEKGSWRLSRLLLMITLLLNNSFT